MLLAGCWLTTPGRLVAGTLLASAGRGQLRVPRRSQHVDADAWRFETTPAAVPRSWATPRTCRPPEFILSIELPRLSKRAGDRKLTGLRIIPQTVGTICPLLQRSRIASQLPKSRNDNSACLRRTPLPRRGLPPRRRLRWGAGVVCSICPTRPPRRRCHGRELKANIADEIARALPLQERGKTRSSPEIRHVVLADPRPQDVAQGRRAP
jgi:hypothetical protein